MRHRWSDPVLRRSDINITCYLIGPKRHQSFNQLHPITFLSQNNIQQTLAPSTRSIILSRRGENATSLYRLPKPGQPDVSPNVSPPEEPCQWQPKKVFWKTREKRMGFDIKQKRSRYQMKQKTSKCCCPRADWLVVAEPRTSTLTADSRWAKNPHPQNIDWWQCILP